MSVIEEETGDEGELRRHIEKRLTPENGWTTWENSAHPSGLMSV